MNKIFAAYCGDMITEVQISVEIDSEISLFCSVCYF